MFRNNKGFSLIFAIFLLIVFSIIGTALITMVSTSHESSAEDLLFSQAFFLAESGAEIRIYQCVKDGNCNDNKTYLYNSNRIKTKIYKLADLPEDKTFYQVKSEAKIRHIKRAIIVKFWK